jgi:hypothetical protein
VRPSDRPCFTWSIIDCWRLALTFSDLSGEFFIAFGVNYPLKVAAFASGETGVALVEVYDVTGL